MSFIVAIDLFSGNFLLLVFFHRIWNCTIFTKQFLSKETPEILHCFLQNSLFVTMSCVRMGDGEFLQSKNPLFSWNRANLCAKASCMNFLKCFSWKCWVFRILPLSSSQYFVFAELNKRAIFSKFLTFRWLDAPKYDVCMVFCALDWKKTYYRRTSFEDIKTITSTFLWSIN